MYAGDRGPLWWGHEEGRDGNAVSVAVYTLAYADGKYSESDIDGDTMVHRLPRIFSKYLNSPDILVVQLETWFLLALGVTMPLAQSPE